MDPDGEGFLKDAAAAHRAPEPIGLFEESRVDARGDLGFRFHGRTSYPTDPRAVTGVHLARVLIDDRQVPDYPAIARP